MKIVYFQRKAPPSLSLYSFTDPVTIYNQNGTIIYTTPYGKSTPNGLKPFAPKSKTAAWDAWYGCVALGVYTAKAITHEKHGKCIQLIGDIPTILPNPAQKFYHFARGILVHCSDTNTWAGSAGCLTVRKSEWSQFIRMFKVGEQVKVEVGGL